MIRNKPYVKINKDGQSIIFEKIFEIILYPESYPVDNIQTLLTTLDCDYVYILHDRDVDDDGILKKAHYHVLIRFDNRHSINSLAKLFEVNTAAISWKSNFRESCKYLFHISSNSLTKAPYEISEARSNISNLEEFISVGNPVNDFESFQASELLRYIDERNITSMRSLMAYAIEYGYYSTLRRSSSLFRDILRENLRRYDREID